MGVGDAIVSPVSMSVVSTVAGDGDVDVEELATGEEEDEENATVLCCGSRRRRISCMAISLPCVSLQHLKERRFYNSQLYPLW